MGTLIYNGGIPLAIDDRTLSHLQVVIINKLRRRETFTFTWDDGVSQTVCWIGQSVPLEFVYSGNRQPTLNRGWLELLALSANSNAGLVALPEPVESHRPPERTDEQKPEPVSA